MKAFSKCPLLLLLTMCGGCTSLYVDRHVADFGQYDCFTAGDLPVDAEPGELKGKALAVSGMQTPVNGTFFFSNGFSTLILDLDGGTYRYWFSSCINRNELLANSPIAGTYSVDGGILRLSQSQSVPWQVQREWILREVNGERTLWRPIAVQNWRDKRAWDYFGVLYKTELQPEDIWLRAVWKIGPSE